jgi:hypothetical protein
VARRLLKSAWKLTAGGPLKKDASIEAQILAYLEEHPTAQDTVEGIVEWWILGREIARATSDVEAALSKLVARKQVRTFVGPDHRVHYQRATLKKA